VSFGHWFRPYYVFFYTKRHLGKFCFQIHEFGSDIIDDNEIAFLQAQPEKKKYSIKKMPLPLSLDTEEGALIIESFN